MWVSKREFERFENKIDERFERLEQKFERWFWTGIKTILTVVAIIVGVASTILGFVLNGK